MSTEYSVTDDPIYFVALFVFTFLTTVLPAGLGQAWFLPLVQTLALTVFLIFIIRRGNIGKAILLVCLWALLQFVLITLLTTVLPGQLELIVADGFGRRAAFKEWFYAGSEPPAGLIDGVPGRIFETASVILGSLATGGLVGFWILVRSVNLAGFYAGGLLGALNQPLNALGALPLWTLLRLCGYALLSVLCAEPILSGKWALGYYIRNRRFYFGIAIGLVAFALLLENTLPGLWRSTFN